MPAFTFTFLQDRFASLLHLFNSPGIFLKNQKPFTAGQKNCMYLLYYFLALLLGLSMSFFAKGSFWERVLFMFMAGCWFFTTLNGLTTIHKKNVLAHKIWMMRSYAMAMTAVTFRVYHIVFYMLNWNHLENYELSLWISVIGNMLFAEWIIYRKSKNYLKSFAA